MHKLGNIQNISSSDFAEIDHDISELEQLEDQILSLKCNLLEKIDDLQIKLASEIYTRSNRLDVKVTRFNVVVMYGDAYLNIKPDVENNSWLLENNKDARRFAKFVKDIPKNIKDMADKITEYFDHYYGTIDESKQEFGDFELILNEDQFKFPSSIHRRRQAAYRSSFGKSKSFGGVTESKEHKDVIEEASIAVQGSETDAIIASKEGRFVVDKKIAIDNHADVLRALLSNMMDSRIPEGINTGAEFVKSIIDKMARTIKAGARHVSLKSYLGDDWSGQGEQGEDAQAEPGLEDLDDDLDIDELDIEDEVTDDMGGEDFLKDAMSDENGKKPTIDPRRKGIY